MKKRLLSMMFVAVCAMFSSLTASAQEPYAVLSSDNKVLTFYYDYNKASRGGMSVGPFTYDSSKDTVNSGWFNNRSKIQTVVFDDSFANCTSITSTACWFFEMFYLQTITGLKNLNTENVTDMSHMFERAQMKELDVSHFNTSKVTDMSEMFCNCSNLESLDLSSFNTKNVEDMSYMFKSNNTLKTIYVDEELWSTEKVVNIEALFYGCTSLVGGNGTSYSESFIDHTYARVDKPGQPGYLTDKNLPAGIDTPISDVTDVVNDKWYTLDGRKLDGAPTTKGV